MMFDFARNARRLAQNIWRHERFYRPEINCPRAKLGNPRASFVVNPSLLSNTSVIYSFGIGTDISFDLQCIERFSARIFAFDPTPRSLQWLSGQTLPAEFIPHPFGIADHDGEIQVYPPHDPSHVSYSATKRGDSEAVSCPVYTLSTIMKMLGHEQVDLLKLDIEGSEYDVIENILHDRIPITQICVEFHHRWPQIGHSRTDAAIDHLRIAGYKLFHVSPSGEEFSFVTTSAS